MPRLLRRREILWPTVWGWLLVLALLGAACFVLVQRAHEFLAVTAPAENATLLVVEGWLSESELDAAADLYRRGSYTRIAVTGGPIEGWADLHGYASFAARAAEYLLKRGLPTHEVVAVPAPASAQDRTFLTAVALRDWLDHSGRNDLAVDVVSSGTHARRTRRLFRAALAPSVAVGVIAIPPSGYDADRWWRSSAGAKAVLGETIGLTWTACCFRAPPHGSPEERWGASIDAVE